MKKFTLTLALLALCTSTLAAELKVLTAGAFKPVVVALAPLFEQRTGHKLSIDNDTAGALQKRIGNGEAFDLVVLTPPAIEQLGASGKVVAGSAEARAVLAQKGMEAP